MEPQRAKAPIKKPNVPILDHSEAKPLSVGAFKTNDARTTVFNGLIEIAKISKAALDTLDDKKLRQTTVDRIKAILHEIEKS